MYKLRTRSLLPVFPILILGLMNGCGNAEDEIRIYKVSRPESIAVEAPRPAQQIPPMSQAADTSMQGNNMQMLPGMDTQVQQIADATWTAPEGWQEPPPRPPRKGNFEISHGNNDILQVTVTAFPGDVGGLLANTNRWRSEVGLDPLAPHQIDEFLKTVTVDGYTAYIVDLTEERSSSGMMATLGAILPRGQSTWFVKMTGDSYALQLQRKNLLEFIESMQFAN